MKRHYDSTLKRAILIARLAKQYYEPGNNAKCYAQVWRKVIYPRYGVHYDTFLRYLRLAKATDAPELPKEDRPIFDLLGV